MRTSSSQTPTFPLSSAKAFSVSSERCKASLWLRSSPKHPTQMPEARTRTTPSDAGDDTLTEDAPTPLSFIFAEVGAYAPRTEVVASPGQLLLGRRHQPPHTPPPG